MELIGFVIKKVISAFLYPLGASLLCIGAGIELRRRFSRSSSAWALVAVGAVWLLVMSMPLTGHLLLSRLEKSAGPYADPERLIALGVKHIVVLGGGATTDKLTAADRVGSDIFRVMEGVRLWKRLPNARIIFSGMGFPSMKSRQEAMWALPLEMGVSRDAIIIEAKAFDTEDEAKLFSPVVGSEPFALVTSAYHIPRAVVLFRSQGLNPVPAPCQYRAYEFQPTFQSVLPSAEALAATTLAVHEYIGIAWLSIKKGLASFRKKSAQ